MSLRGKRTERAISVSCGLWKWNRVCFDCGVVLIQNETEQQGDDAADHVAEVGDFFDGERATEQSLFAVAELLLEDLVAAERVFPGRSRDVFPMGFGVENNVAVARGQLREVSSQRRCFDHDSRRLLSEQRIVFAFGESGPA